MRLDTLGSYTLAVAANDDFCGLQSTVTANLVPGYFYVVVSEFSAPGGAYVLNVTGLACGTPATSTATRTATSGVATTTSTATCTAGGAGVWTAPQAPYPINISNEACVTLNGLLYCFGGTSNSVNVASAYKYDPATNTWTAIASLPGPRQAPSAVTDGTYIYVINGYDGAVTTNTLFRYDPVANTYTTLAPNTTATFAQWAAYLGGHIYKGSGNNGTVVIPVVEDYNIATNTWTVTTPDPDPASFKQATTFGGFVWTASGSTPSVKTHSFNGVVWCDACMTDMPVDLWGAAHGILNGRWIIGPGASGGFISNVVYAINMSNPTGPWVALPPAPLARYRLSGGVVGSSYYAVGGNPFTGTTDNQRYTEPPCATTTSTVGATNTSTRTSTATVCVPSVPIQEIEPNNTIAQANPVPISGAEVRGGINPAGDRDYFSFTANAGDRIWSYINTSNAAPSTDSILTLMNALSSTIQLDDDNGFQSTLSSAIAGGVITTTGVHALEVRQFGGATVMDPYSLYIDRTTSATIPEVEPNNTFGTANPYAFGTVVTASIPISTDLDYYTFTLAQNEKVVIQVDGDPDRNGTNLSRVNQFNPNFDLLDSNGAVITAVDSDSQGGNGGLLSENLVYTNTSTISTTFGIVVKFDPSTPPEDDLGIYNLHMFKVGGGICGSVTATTTATTTRTSTATTTRTATCVAGGAGTPGPFVVASPAPIDHYGAETTTNGTVAYFIGGYSFSASGPINQFSRFDPVANTWASMTPVPDAHYESAAVYSPLNNKIYDFGGTDSSAALNTTRIYDLATNTWSTGAPIPAVRQQMAYGYYNGKIYLAGGYDSTSVTPQSTVYEYDVATNTWATKAPLPQALGGPGSGVIGSKLYVAGGRDVSVANRNSLYIYDIPTNTWTTGPNLANGVNVPASAVVGDKLFIMGGGNPFLGPNGVPVRGKAGGSDDAPSAPNTTNTTQYLDTTTNTWAVGPVMSTPRSFADGVGVGNRAIVVGGYTGSTTTAITEISTFGTTGGCITPVTATTTRTATTQATATCQPGGGGGTLGPWRTATVGPSARYRAGGVTDGTYVYVLGGGTSTGTFLNDVWRWTPATETWTAMAPMPIPRQNHQGSYWNGKIYVPGGFTTGSIHTTQFDIYDIATNAWSAGPPLPVAHTCATAAFNGKIYCLGGNTNTTRTDIYDIATNTWTQGPNMPQAGGVTYGRAITAGNFIYYVGGILTSVVTPQVWRLDPVALTWTQMASLQQCRSAEELGTNGTKIFAVNGGGNPACDSAGYFVGVPQANTVEVYDIASNTWTYGNPTVQTASSVAGGLAGGKFMIQGGVNGTVYYDMVQVSDLQAGGGGCATATRTATSGATATCVAGGGGAWAQYTPLPGPRMGAGVATLGSFLYEASGESPTLAGSARVRGSHGPSLAARAVDRPDVRSLAASRTDGVGGWTPIGNVLTGVLDGSGVADSQYFYLIGGYGATVPVTDNQRYDPVAGTWVQRAPVPLSVAGAAAVYTNNLIYVIGGCNDGSCSAPRNTVQIYNPATNTWTTGSVVPQGVAFGHAEAIGQYIYLAGGVDQSGQASLKTYRYDPVANTWNDAAMADMPETWWAGATGVINGQMYIAGGVIQGFALVTNRTITYNPTSNTWANDANMNIATYRMQGDVLAGSMYVVGGSTGGFTPNARVERLTPGGGCATSTATRTATTGASPTSTACAISNVVLDGSFEGGSPSQFWTEESTNFGTPLCDPACGTGGGTAGPRTGSWWAWFGGTADTEDGAISQSVNIPAGTATLQFYLWIGAHSGGGATDYLRVLVGGTEVFRATDLSTQYNAGYTLVTVDVSAQSGGSRVLRFEEHNGTAGVINFNVDDVSLNVGGGCVTSTVTRTSTSTSTIPVVTSTATRTSTTGATATRTNTATNTGTATNTSTRTSTPTATINVECQMPFTDVDQFNPFYIYIRCLYCRGIISGYNTGCPTGNPCFKPYNDITRGQIAKMVSNSAGFAEPVSGQRYTDVPPSHTFYVWIMRLTLRGHMSGYNDALNCAGVGIPCFRPERPATRGQLSKIVSNAAGFDEPPVGQTFQDVLPSNPFYPFIQRLSRRGVISGYDCGTGYINPCTMLEETCDGQNRPYFRWCANVTRGQASKIVANTFFPLNCQPGLPELPEIQE